MTHEAQPWLMARFKSHGQLSIRFNWTFLQSITFPELWGEMRTRVSTSLHSNFTWTGASTINRSYHQKIINTGLLDSEDCIPLCYLVLTQYRCVTARRADRRICRNIYSSLQS